VASSTTIGYLGRLFADAARIDRLDPPDDLVNDIRLVVDGHQDGQKWGTLHFAQRFLWKLIQEITIDTSLQSMAYDFQAGKNRDPLSCFLWRY
jgi:hypothetical protein